MKNLSTVLSALALIGVLVLFGLHFSGDKKSKPKVITSGDMSGVAANSKIAYIDIDTFEAHYEVLKAKKEEFKKRQANEEAELQRSAQQFQNDVTSYQGKGASMSDAERQATEKRLGQMQQNITTRKTTMEEQFQKDQMKFQDFMNAELDAFFEDYNGEKQYDYILGYSRINPVIMYKNKALDITQEVIEGINARKSAAPAATTKAK